MFLDVEQTLENICKSVGKWQHSLKVRSNTYGCSSQNQPSARMAYLVQWIACQLYNQRTEVQFCSIPIRAMKFVSSSNCPNCICDSPTLLYKWYRGLFPLGAKQPKCKTGHLPPSCANVKNEYSYNSTPHTRLYDMHRNNFTVSEGVWLF